MLNVDLSVLNEIHEADMAELNARGVSSTLYLQILFQNSPSCIYLLNVWNKIKNKKRHNVLPIDYFIIASPTSQDAPSKLIFVTL